MFRMIGTGLIGLLVLGMATTGRAQGTAAQKGAAPAANAPSGGVQPIPGATDVLATVTSRDQTDKVTKGDVISFLSRYPLPPQDEREIAYSKAMEILVNTVLLKHYLTAQRIQIPESRIDEQVERVKDQVKKEGQDLNTLLQQNGSSLDEMRKEFANNLRFDEFARNRTTDAVLRRYLNENKDRFGRTQVRASHILLKAEPNAGKEEKDKVRQKLEAIRKEIVGGKISFAAAANKYSEDPANAGGAGGDLDYFTLDSGFVDEFADAAFKLKKGEVSEPVETPFGFHLIQVTDRKEGKLPDFEQNKPFLTNAYRMELQKEIVTDERKSAKIDIKPMPKDLFPSEPPAGAAAAPGAPAAVPAPGGGAAPKP
jgi:parvulin-like peptidyl-prolyl isomerase